VTGVGAAKGARQPKMTLRVYTRSQDGTVTTERAEVRVIPGEPDTFGFGQTYPPCACPRCR
jgi:hypothetical protein